MPFALTDRLWKRILWIAALGLLAYLPAALQLTYYRDDWYYAYDAMVGPAGVFRYMFAEDRPARGPFFELYYALFGIAPTPYHLAMLFWRIAGGAAVTWLFHLLWPRRATAGLVAGALFALYPGFTWWVQGIEYQPMVASVALMVVSLCLTVLALHGPALWPRVLCVAGAVLSGWIYLALVEYAAGIEIFRLVLIFSAVQAPKLHTLRARAVAALRQWLPYLIIPVGFVLWRFFVFASERKATDLGWQLSGFFAEPLSTGLHWLMSFLLSFLNVTLSAWVQPLQTSFFPLRLREQMPALAFALAAGALIWWLLRSSEVAPTRKPAPRDENWQLMAIWLGLAALGLGILPVVVANRQITFPNFSHYALPASLGFALFIVGLVDLVANRDAQTAAHVGLIALSVLTLQGIGASALREERIIANFWHQMAWRAPSIQPGTTLLISYPAVDYGTDTDVVWGPANLIYFPGKQDRLPVQLQVGALESGPSSVRAILWAGEVRRESTYRSHTMRTDLGTLLVAAQSASDSCVRVMGSRTLNSIEDEFAVVALGSHSNDQLVREAGSPPELPAGLFGVEPERGWCYYFEMASLAEQQRKWNEIVPLYAEVTRRGLQPNDPIEWMPFLAAKAKLGDASAVKAMMSRLNTERQYHLQACSVLSIMGIHNGLPAQTQEYIDEQCR